MNIVYFCKKKKNSLVIDMCEEKKNTILKLLLLKLIVTLYIICLKYLKAHKAHCFAKLFKTLNWFYRS